MRRLALFSALTAFAFTPLDAVAQPRLKREADEWSRTITGTAKAQLQLRVNGHGPVTLEGGVSKEFSYTVKISVMARTEAQARPVLERAIVRAIAERGVFTLTVPGGAALSSVSIRAPRLTKVEIATSEGPVEARGVDGPLTATSGAGELTVDRIRGACTLITGGGAVHVGQVDGPLHCTTGAGHITARVIGGDAILETKGGDI